ncbi:MAG TPA: hypothetical protein VF469_25005, partial [Kofleriaceae bacterium]
GLCKFGQPDLVLLGISPEAAPEAAVILRDIAQTLADGERIEPGDQIASPDGRTWTAARFEPDMSPIVAVDGPAMYLGEAPPGRAAG